MAQNEYKDKNPIIYLAGIGMGREDRLTGEVLDCLDRADAVMGARRMLDSAAAYTEGKAVLGVAVAFIYGYFATIEGSMLNWFPIKAAMILVDPKCGSEYGITYKIPPAAMSIIGVLVVSILLFQMLNRTKKNVYMKSKRKVKVKQTRRKGW